MKFIGLTFRWVVSTLFILFGPVYFVGGILIVAGAYASKSWPSVQGVVVSSQVVKHQGKGVSYSPTIRYRYQVGSGAFENGAIWLLDFGADEERAREIVARFPPGPSAPVFYDPSSPARSALIPGTNWFMFATIGMGLVAFLVGVIMSPVTGRLWNRLKA